MREDPEGYLKLTKRIFQTQEPTRADIQSLLKVLLTGEEKATIFSKFQEKANKENRNNAGYAIFRLGNQAVLDNEPNWDQLDNGEGGERQRLTRYKSMILKRIQTAGQKPVNWNKIQEINQKPTENP